MFSSAEIKLYARTAMKRRTVMIILTALVFLAARYLVQYLVMELTGLTDWLVELNRRAEDYMQVVQSAATQEELEAAIGGFHIPDIIPYLGGVFPQLLALALMLMLVPLQGGYYCHALFESRGINTPVSSVFSGFSFTGKLLAISILKTIAAIVGYILLIVPGVVVSYMFAVAEFVLFDNPELGPIQCLRRSAQIMRGNKWRYFKLQFSFIMWMIASELVLSFIGLPLLDLWLLPYMTISSAVFYSQLVWRPDAAPEAP